MLSKMGAMRTVTGILLLAAILNEKHYLSDGAKILIYPVDFGFNSRAVNMAKMGTYLKENGHHVTITLNEEILNKYNPDHLHIIKYELPSGIKLSTDPDVLEEMENIMNSYFSMLKAFDFVGSLNALFCNAFLSDKTLLTDLKAENYDLLLFDYGNECGRILSDYLDIPTILYSNHGFHPNDFIYPRLQSISCDSFSASCSGDVMSFKERLKNFINFILYDNILYPRMLSYFQDLRNKHKLNTSISILEPVRSKQSIIITNVDFVLDYPRPLMPHIFPISGLIHREPNELPDDLKNFISNSLFKQIVVVSFGTLIEELPYERAESLAKIFSKLSALVIWRQTGPPPKALGENTKLVGWFPQYDVLSHPQTKLFVTHCGVSGTFEAASLGIPVLAVPILGDQRYHALQLVNRLKMGVMTDWSNFREEEFERDLFSVFNNPIFAQNAREAADLMNDRPIDPKYMLTYLVNYTIKHGGAKHLVSGPGQKLNSLQFYSVDIILFLVLIGFIVILVLYYTCKFSFQAGKRMLHKVKHD